MNTQTKEQNRQIEELMKEFISQTVAFYNHIDQEPLSRPADQKTLKNLAKHPIPAQARPLREVYREMLQDVYSDALLCQHPRFFSCIPSTASLLSWMGDVMTNAYNPHASCQINGPSAALVEEKLIHWMCSLAGFPEKSGGLFVSGGSIANLTALTAARDAKLAGRQRENAVVYVSDQTHSSVAKGLHIIGFEPEQIRIVPSDFLFRMDMDALKAALRKDVSEGRRPFAVVASAGTTNTGSVDPMTEISALCRKYDMWMHVDGAFGASLLLSQKYRQDLAGIHLADSLSWDAHKWLLQTYGCSVVLVRERSNLVKSFAAHPEYLKDSQASEDSIEFWDLGPELTRPARSLKLWLTLQAMGTDQIGGIIDRGCAMAQLAEKIIGKNPRWEIVCPAQHGVVNFRYRSDGRLRERELDEINHRIAKEITESGFAQIYTTQLKGKTVLRMCTINPETTERDIRETVERLMEMANAGTEKAAS